MAFEYRDTVRAYDLASDCKRLVTRVLPTETLTQVAREDLQEAASMARELADLLFDMVKQEATSG